MSNLAELENFMHFVKETIEAKRYPIYSTKNYCRSATLCFYDETYGCVLVNFYRVEGYFYQYKATASNNSNLTLISSVDFQTATGIYNVTCRDNENNLFKYPIIIGEKYKKHKK